MRVRNEDMIVGESRRCGWYKLTWVDIGSWNSLSYGRVPDGPFSMITDLDFVHFSSRNVRRGV